MAEQFTEDWFIHLWGTQDKLEREAARRIFRKHFAGENCLTHIDPAMVARDRGNMTEAVESVVDHVDTSIAHMDKKPAEIPTFQELHTAIDAISRAFRKYYLLMTADEFDLETVAVNHDWERIFTLPWK